MRRFFCCMFLLLLALPAHAIRITNLDTVPHVLIVNNGGEIAEITLLPSHSYTTFGPMVDLRVKGKHDAKRADPFGDYAIWKGGNLVIQRIHDGKNH